MLCLGSDMARSCGPMLGFILFVCAIRLADSVHSSAVSGGDVMGQSDFQINLRPPVENAEEIQEALGALQKSEAGKIESLTEALSREQQRMLSEEKAALHNIVVAAFKPLIGKIGAQ